MHNYLSKFRLDGRTAVVTGGANGLGATMAEGLASAGADVAILDLNLDHGERVANHLANTYGVKTKAWQLNVTDPTRVPRVLEEVLAELRRIDVLLNNAGIWRNVPAEDMPWDDWHDVIDVCLTGTFLMSQCAAKQFMIPNGGGRIVNIGSVSGMFINDPPYKCSYNAAKAGVIMLTQALAAEWARYNIRVNCISPCTAKHRPPQGEPSESQARAWGTIPMGRHAYSEELCGALLYLASDASSFVTGINLPVDGGDTIWKGSEPIGIIGGPEGNQ
jgi:NAD(P)-dependent dehydrogenase (short-subunit alcohol dehydrogenase family)